MTEEQIELAVERQTDALDRQYMAGRLTDDAYKALLRDLDAWAEGQYRVATKSETVEGL